MAPPQRREDALTFGVRGQESNSELNPAAASLSATASPAPINEHVRCRWSRRIVSWRRCANWEDAVFDQPGTIWHPPPDMDLVCPLCRSAIAIDDINVATDIALCRRCSKTFSFSELIGASAGAAPDLTAPPSGAWFEPLADGFRTGATTRSWMALYLVPFTCAWSGISLGGIYGKQISSGHFDPASSLFGLPFLIGSVFLIGCCAMTTTGKVELSQRSGSLSVFTGVGRLGWTRYYLWSDFSSARGRTAAKTGSTGNCSGIGTGWCRCGHAS